jgi:hypothetical protein
VVPEDRIGRPRRVTRRDSSEFHSAERDNVDDRVGVANENKCQTNQSAARVIKERFSAMSVTLETG